MVSINIQNKLSTEIMGDKVFKSFKFVLANGLSCYTCPFSSSGEDKCLTDGAELGESTECNNFQNACETLAIGRFVLIH